MMRPYLGELIGTFVLVFGGCGAAVLAGGHIGFAGVAAAFGLSLLAMIYTVGPISGCHPNSAVKVLDGKIDDLLVIAEPRTLGELRKHYHKSLVAKLVGEIPKDLAGADSASILRTVAAA